MNVLQHELEETSEKTFGSRKTSRNLNDASTFESRKNSNIQQLQKIDSMHSMIKPRPSQLEVYVDDLEDAQVNTQVLDLLNIQESSKRDIKRTAGSRSVSPMI